MKKILHREIQLLLTFDETDRRAFSWLLGGGAAAMLGYAWQIGLIQ
jgi:hypothetical protein